jgi:hypothetical protein
VCFCFSMLTCLMLTCRVACGGIRSQSYHATRWARADHSYARTSKNQADYDRRGCHRDLGQPTPVKCHDIRGRRPLALTTRPEFVQRFESKPTSHLGTSAASRVGGVGWCRVQPYSLFSRQPAARLNFPSFLSDTDRLTVRAFSLSTHHHPHIPRLLHHPKLIPPCSCV